MVMPEKRGQLKILNRELELAIKLILAWKAAISKLCRTIGY
jgi:hypothetical protein